MSTHNICFPGEIRKISEYFGAKSSLSGAMGMNGYEPKCEIVYLRRYP